MAATVYVAFLRAVNVGGRIIKMAELKTIFERLGLKDVSTFIASGNVIFTSATPPAKLEQQIASSLQKALGFPVPAMLRSTREVAAAAEFQPYTPKTLDGASMYVGFLQEKPAAAAVKKLLALQTDALRLAAARSGQVLRLAAARSGQVDQLRLNGREVYWLARKSIAESTISMAVIEKAAQTPATFRNINTVRRLAAKYPG